jgi:hypothetical protein
MIVIQNGSRYSVDPFTDQKFFDNVWDVISLVLWAAMEAIEKAKPRPNFAEGTFKSGEISMTLEKGQKVLSARETKSYFEEFGRHPENPSDHALMDKILSIKPDYKWLTNP